MRKEIKIKMTGYTEHAVRAVQNRVNEISVTIMELLEKKEKALACLHDDITYCGEYSHCKKCGASLIELFEIVNAERLALRK